ncbi:MAG TPA: twin-arginine translocase TatA/TatE family subunit [Candidatus Sulfotelmatobacter sp.]
MSIADTIFLFVLALVLFGPKKLPEIARTIGKYMNEFKRASNEFKAQIEQEISNLEVEKRQTILPPSPPVTGVTSRSAANQTLSSSTAENATLASANDVPATETSATSTPSDDEPLFAADAGSASTRSSPTDVKSESSQESHV